MEYEFDTSPSRLFMLDKIKEGDVCAEIGVLKGDYAHLICSRPISELHLVDPWISISDVPDRWHAVPQEKMDEYKTEVINRFADNDKVKIIEKYSIDAASDFEDGSIDWLYLDANHSYDFVCADLNAWWPKIKPSGFLCGNAYSDSVFQVNVLDFGVVPAVDSFLEEKFDTIQDFENEGSQYIIQKA
jgi:hypothetical protein|tara:strand:+ start:7950 stop:8510 length:561 start_codon:yes stop_codon:yes gene_type:complete